MKKFFLNLFFKTDDSTHRLKTFFNDVQLNKKEKRPDSVHIFKSTVPDGMTMDEWLNGGWSRYKRNNPEDFK